jgi:hypothetical protein
MMEIWKDRNAYSVKPLSTIRYAPYEVINAYILSLS